LASPLYLLDTNVVLTLARRGEAARSILVAYPLLTAPVRPLITYAAEVEVRVIAELNSWGAPKRNQLAFLLGSFGRASVETIAVRDAYVAIDVYSRHSGFEMGKNDLWIAAAANAYGATLLTTDRDFDHLDPLFLSRVWIDPAATMP
jgi:predicted nucleic acid-binding protein